MSSLVIPEVRVRIDFDDDRLYVARAISPPSGNIVYTVQDDFTIITNTYSHLAKFIYYVTVYLVDSANNRLSLQLFRNPEFAVVYNVNKRYEVIVEYQQTDDFIVVNTEYYEV